MPVASPVMRSEGSIRVGTWNLQEGAASRLAAALAADDVAHVVASLDLDFLALQEVPFEHSDGSRMLETLSERTGMVAAHILALSPGHHDPTKQSGLAILATTRPVGKSSATFGGDPALGSSRIFTKGVVTCDFPLGGGRIRIASCHLFPFSRFSIDPSTPTLDGMWASLATVFPRTSGEWAIVCGDFNTEDRGPLFRRVGYPLSSTTEGLATHHGKSYDDLIFTPSISPEGPPTVLDLHSDHALCVAQFSVKP